MWAKYGLGFTVLWSIIYLSLISVVHASGVFELKLHHFLNDDGLNSDGNCCNGIRQSGSCSSACHTFFRICLKHYQTNVSPNPPCTFGELTTKIIGDNTFDFPDQTPNPIRFPIGFGWPGTFSLIIEAFHDTTLSQPREGSPRELISQLATQRSVEVGEVWSNDVHKTASTELKYSYRVVCDQDYYGRDCLALCRDRDDNFGHYTCNANGTKECLEGWQGDYCDKGDSCSCQLEGVSKAFKVGSGVRCAAICLPGCDQEHGHCELPNECKCHTGWEGRLCDQCILYPGCQHGTCVKPWECNCTEGWGGLFCNQDLVYCHRHHPCKHGGTCKNHGPGSYLCECPPEYSGTNCEIEVLSNCLEKPCLNGGTCMRGTESNYQCQCPHGYQGRQCEISATSCQDQPCQNGGTCSSTQGGYVCTCPAGYTGFNCDLLVDNCEDNKCQNDGRCVNHKEGYTCHCNIGYSGQFCELNINDCQKQPCLNGGTCQDKVNEFKCSCVTGFVGPLCEIDINECETYPCANGGSCHDLVNDFMCDCPSGFTGKDCRYNVDECASAPCHNGGTCRDRVGHYECICVTGFYGRDCEFSPSGSVISKTRSSSTMSPQRQTTVADTPVSPRVPSSKTPGVLPHTEFKNDSVITMQQLLLIICLGVGIPILIIVGIIVFLLINKRRSHQTQEDNSPKENEENEKKVTNMNNKSKCFDTNIINTIPPNNASLKITNEEQDCVRNKNHNRYYIEKPTNNKNINENIERQRCRNMDVLYERELNKPDTGKVLDSDSPSAHAGKVYADSLDSSEVDVSEYTSREPPAEVHHGHSVVTPSKSNNSILLRDPYTEGMLATEV